MWQRIRPNDLAALQTAFEIVAIRDPKWRSVEQLRNAIVGQHMRLYYFGGRDYELVVGFQFDRQQQEWRAAVGGGRGELDETAANEMARKTVAFAEEVEIKSLALGPAKERPSPTDPTVILMGVLSDALLEQPEVAEIRERLVPGGLWFEVVLH